MHNINPDDKYAKITLALAGIFQSGYLVDQLANTGQCDEKAFLSCINSIFKLDAPNVPAVYEGAQNLKIGFSEMLKVFNKRKASKPNPHISRYAISLVFLQQQLMNNAAMLQQIHSRVKHAVSQVHYFNEINATVIANLADIYLKTISKLRHRIQIIGQAPHLHNEAVTNKIRALLLAGIRSAVLWHQVGGRRWQLFFSRATFYKIAKSYLSELP